MRIFQVNAQLLRITGMVNRLDGCWISLPRQAPGELSVELVVWHGPMRDDAVLNVAQQIERLQWAHTRNS